MNNIFQGSNPPKLKLSAYTFYMNYQAFPVDQFLVKKNDLYFNGFRSRVKYVKLILKYVFVFLVLKCVELTI